MPFQLQTGVRTLDAVLLHEWAGPYSGANEAAAKAAANAAIPTGVRLMGLEVTLIIAGVPKKYWYGTGILNGDLIPMPAGSSLTISDEGSPLTTGATSINFTGAGVTATNSGTAVTVTINGGGGGSGSPGGNNGYVQFNSNSSFGGDSNFFWDNTNKKLGIGTSTVNSLLHLYYPTSDLTSSSNSHIFLQNPSTTGQTSLWFQTNSNFTGKIRSDYAGNMNYVSKDATGLGSGGKHYFWTGGDADLLGSGSSVNLQINPSAIILGAHDPSSYTDTGENVQVLGSMHLAGYLDLPSGPGASGQVLTSSGGNGALTWTTPAGAATTTLVDLLSNNYEITQPGIYYIKEGTNIDDPNADYYINIKAPSNFQSGDKITIVNKDVTNFFAAYITIDIAGGEAPILFQGGVDLVHDQNLITPAAIYGRVTNVPSGMTYVLELVVPNAQNEPAYWMCHPTNTEPFYDGICLTDDDTPFPNIFPLYIHNHGVYNIIRGSKEDKSAKIYFPNPIHNIGKKVTILTLQGEACEVDGTYPIFLSGFDPTGTAGAISVIPGGANYVFMAVNKGEYTQPYWTCIYADPKPNPSTVTTMDLTGADYSITQPGVYTTTYDAEIYGVNLPPASDFAGQTIIIIYRPTGSTVLNIVNYATILDGATGSGFYSFTKGVHQLISIGTYWIRASYA